MGVGTHILRGVVCGLVAGLLAGVFAFFLVEPTIDRALALEYAAAQAAGTLQPEVFSRTTQHIGLVVATSLLGAALGGLFGILFFAINRGRSEGQLWERSLALGGALFLGFYLMPFIHYPANPPGTGDPATIDQRQLTHAAMTLLGLLAVFGAWRIQVWLQGRGLSRPWRQTWVALAFTAFVATCYLVLPSDHDPARVPAALLWDFRLFSVATQLILWICLSWGFGLWSARAAGVRSSVRALAS